MSAASLYVVFNTNLQSLAGGAGALMHTKYTLMQFCNALGKDLLSKCYTTISVNFSHARFP